MVLKKIQENGLRKKKKMLTKTKTQRGLTLYTGKDRYGKEFSIQDSSLADEACIWLGSEESRAHLTIEQVKEIIPILQGFVEKGLLP